LTSETSANRQGDSTSSGVDLVARGL